MTTFTELGLGEATLRAITELGYEEPTPIQAQSIGLMLSGNDIIAQAQTGTGKTAAFSLPTIERIDPKAMGVQALILTPTRELAVQVSDAISAYGKYLNIRALPVYGGQPIDRQLRALKRGVNIVIGTPGRLMDHMERGTLDLSTVRTVVLDEADEMLNMGFVDDIEYILERAPKDRQTALYSATMPDEIARLARKYLKSPQMVTIEREQLTVPQIRQVYYEIGARDKFEVLTRILDLEMPTSAIIFCRTKAMVDELGEKLLARGYGAELLHGDLSQAMRDRVMKRFREEQVEILVATDVAARGLDIEHVSHVINYDIPLDPEAYVHRIGRTGRAGRSGVAVTLVTPRERRQLRTIERMTGAPIQRLRLPTIADVVARRREAFKDNLRELIEQHNEQGGLEQYLVLAEELAEQYSPTDLAAAAFKMMLGEPDLTAEDPLEMVEDEATFDARRGDRRDSRDNGRRGDRRDNGRAGERGGDRGGDRAARGPRSGDRNSGGRSFREEGMTRLFVDIGREQGVRPADIVGAIANESGLPGRAIGAIDIFDNFTFVDVPDEAANRVLAALGRTQIRGVKITPTLARPRR
ncbi:DEAD/DEAH box helicase [Herpetosiphon gulosus]|uniref:RNA helicase n=1 Tax=Herpetosiphon gulosus TaxID=1973496 RepID=A0ABP9WTC3_9CHLR